MRQSLILLLCLAALLLTACGGNPSAPADESTPAQDVSDSSATTSTTTGTPASGNEMDGADWFDTTTGSATSTTAGTTGSGTTSSGTTTAATTTAATTVATTTSTTVAPPRQQEQNSVSLPATGYDPDGKGRLLLGEVTLRGQTVYMEVCNISATWMTEETAYYQYTCYDKNGRVLTLSEETFGYIYLGQLRAGRSKTYTFTLPQGTRRVEITGYHVPYWTEWS